MKAEALLRSVVIVGLFHVSDFDKYFFVKTGIVSAEEWELDEAFFEAAGMVQLTCPNFNIVVTTHQIIIADSNAVGEKAGIDIYGIAKLLIAGLRHLNDKTNHFLAGTKALSALGINFNWFLLDGETPINRLSKAYFYNDRVPIFPKFFGADDAAFGASASTDVGDARLKLDIRPTTIQDPVTSTSKNYMGFLFNFHFSFNNDLDVLERYLDDHAYYGSVSEQIMSNYVV